MKILVIGNPQRYEKFSPGEHIIKRYDVVYCPADSSGEELLKAGWDADVILADAISEVSAQVIGDMPNLKMIHSEGVAYNKIDLNAASERKIYVCNNKGGNAGAVAEQTILLILGLLRTIIPGHEAVLEGNQIARKEKLMVSGITDLADCTVGLLGMGDIAKETAKRLHSFGCRCVYYSRNRKSAQMEEELCVTYKPLDELLSMCDIISLHMAVGKETVHFMNHERFSKMKQGSYVINTGRGELIENKALCEALENNILAGAGLDTVFPEPVQNDNPVVEYAAKHPGKILFSPHIGGVTTGSFKRMHRHMWENVQRIERGERPDCVVNEKA